MQYKPSRYNILVPLDGGRTLAFNTLRHTLAMWEKEDGIVYGRILKNGCFLMDVAEENILQDLHRGGFVVPETEDEMRRIAEGYSMLRFGRKTMSLTIAPTLQCNFACDYCYQGHDADKQVMDEKVFGALLSFLQTQAPGLSRLHVAWYGGEPLLQEETVYRMSDGLMALCAQHGVRYSAMMVTNGYRLTGDTAQKLAKKQVSTIQVTLDGDQKTHDMRRIKKDGSPTFERILRNLKEAVTCPGVSIVVRVNIDKRNAEGVFGLLDVLDAQGFSGRPNFSVYFAPVDVCSAECTRIAGEVLSHADYAQIEMALLKKAISLRLAAPQLPGSLIGMCAAIKPNGFVVLPNGDVHKCWNTVSDRAQRACTTDTLQDAGQTKVFEKWISWSPFSMPKCADCDILPVCAGACANRAMLGGEPCVSLKENIREKLLLYALQKGAISKKDLPSAEAGTAL